MVQEPSTSGNMSVDSCPVERRHVLIIPGVYIHIWVARDQGFEGCNVALLGKGVDRRLQSDMRGTTRVHRASVRDSQLTGGGASSIMVSSPTSSLFLRSGSSPSLERWGSLAGDPVGGVAAVVVI